jgi:hypothetical protein
MTKNTRQEFRALLNRQSQALIDKAVRTGGTVCQEEVEALARLKRLIEIPDPESYRRRWLLPAALITTLIAITVLLFIRISSSEIELEASVSEVSFRAPTPQALTDDAEVVTLVAAGLRRIQLPGDHRHPEQDLKADDDDGKAVRLAVDGSESSAGSITLSGLQVPAAGLATIRYSGVRFVLG